MPKRKTEERSAYHHGDLRAALLHAAEAELAENGIEGFTLRGCAKRAGVSHAAPAHHFKDANALLTALAAIGFERFVAAQDARRAQADPDPLAQQIASGVGYIDFAAAHPSLFNLMFGSRKPLFADAELDRSASKAFADLVEGVANLHGGEPMQSRSGRIQVAKAWSDVHGIATLLIAGRLHFLDQELKSDREATIHALVSLAMSSAG